MLIRWIFLDGVYFKFFFLFCNKKYNLICCFFGMYKILGESIITLYKYFGIYEYGK